MVEGEVEMQRGMQAQVQPRAFKWTMPMVLAFVLLLSIIVGVFVYTRLIVPAAPLNFDEAAHSLPGFYILRDVRHLDARAFWGDTHIQTLWPPGFSYLQAPFLAVLGRTDASARLFAYLMLVGTLLMGGAIARQIDRDLAPAALLISGLLTLTAPGWLFVSSWAMQEAPVAFVLFVVFWLYLRARQTQQLRWHVLTSLGLFFLFLTKYNYAAFALASIGLIDLVGRIRTLSRGAALVDLARKKSDFFHDDRLKPPLHVMTHTLLALLALYLPFALGLLGWFFGGTDIVPTEVKWRDFRFFVTNEDSGYPFWSEQNLLFYVRIAANWLMPHWLILLLSVALAVVALWKIRHAGVALLAVFFGLGFILATIHQLKAERYITPIFPALWLLAGLGGAVLMRQRRGRVASLAPWALVGLSALVFAFIALPRMQPVWLGNDADGLRAAADQIVRWQNPQRHVLIVGTFGELSPPLFEWRLRPLPAYAADATPPHGEIQYDAPPGEGDDLQRIAAWTQKNTGTQITVIQVDETAPLFNTNDMRNKNAWRQKLANAFVQNHERLGYQLVEQQSLPGGLKISYYLPAR